LPLLPLIAAGAIARHPLGPVAMAAGLAASFTIAGLGIYALTRATGIAQEDVSFAAGWVMVGFGAILLIPQAQEGFARLAGAAAGGGSRMIGKVEGNGLGGEFAAGALMGLAWSPCIGPTLGAAIGLAAQGENLIFASLIMVMFSAGSATIILALGYGARGLISSRRDLLARIAPFAHRILGVGLVIVGLAIVFRLDQLAEGWVLDTLPYWFTDLSVSI
jgi:cytochrome c biogenesis protein CcdA